MIANVFEVKNSSPTTIYPEEESCIPAWNAFNVSFSCWSFPYSGMVIKFISSTKTRSDLWIPFSTRQSLNRKVPRVFYHFPLCYSSRNKASMWVIFLLFPATVRITSKVDLVRARCGAGLQVSRITVAALSKLPVPFPVCLYHKAFNDHSCPFWSHSSVWL